MFDEPLARKMSQNMVKIHLTMTSLPRTMAQGNPCSDTPGDFVAGSAVGKVCLVGEAGGIRADDGNGWKNS